MNTTNPKVEDDRNYHNEQCGENELSNSERYFSDLRDQFAALPMAIFEDVRSGHLNSRDVCLYAHFLAKQGIKPTSYWGVDRLAELTGTSETTVKSSIRRLEATDHIARLPGTATTHTVCLTRLDPRKGSKRILIKDKSLVPPPRKAGTAYGRTKPARSRASESYRSHPKGRMMEQDEHLDSRPYADEYLPF